MRPRTTLILLFLVVSLGAFTYYWERHQRSTIERRTAGNLTGLKAENIETMEIHNASGISKFKKRATDGVWNLTEPFDDRVDPEFLKRMLELAEKAEIADTLEEKDIKSSDRKSYGLDDKTAIQIAWKVGGRTTGRLKIGKIGALGDTVYAEAPGNKEFPEIYLIWARPDPKQKNVRDELARPIAEMRDTLLLPIKSNQVVSFSIRRPGTAGEITASRQLLSEKEATPWTLLKPLKARGEQNEIDNLVGLFATARVNKLLPPGPAPSGLPAVPAVEIQFQSSFKAKGTTIRLYPPDAADPNSAIGFLTDRKAWFTIDKEFIEAIPEDTTKLRSHTLIDLDYRKLTTMIIENRDGETIPLYRAGNRWVIQKSDKTFIRASGDRVAKTIQNLNQAEIGKFVTDSLTNPADYGLDKPFQSITFGTPEHKGGIAELKPETSLTLLFGTDKDGRLYANIKGESSVYLMLPDHFGLVPPQLIKWRDSQILDFTRPSIRRLQQTLGTTPPITLNSPPRSFEWTVTRAGNNVTPLLLSENVERLIGRLSTLNVAEWLPGLQEGYKALQEPSLVIDVDIEYVEDKSSINTPTLKKLQLSFAPSGDAKQALFYIGHCNEIPDYFLISREAYRELAAPLLANPK